MLLGFLNDFVFIIGVEGFGDRSWVLILRWFVYLKNVLDLMVSRVVLLVVEGLLLYIGRGWLNSVEVLGLSSGIDYILSNIIIECLVICLWILLFVFGWKSGFFMLVILGILV